MKTNLTITIYTQADLGKVEIMKALWNKLDKCPVLPERFDSVERAKIPFELSKYESASELYKSKRMLFVRGPSTTFQAVFTKKKRPLSFWDFYFSEKTALDSENSLWLKWLTDLAKEIPILYGYACSQEEYNAKHLHIEYFEDGGHAESWPGIAIRDFWNFLPGVYWLNFFGSELINDIDVPKLQSLDNWETTLYDSNLLTTRFKSTALPYNAQEREDADSKLRAALGSEHIYSRDESTNGLSQFPSLLKALG